MKGFSFILVLIFVLCFVQLLVVETKLVEDAKKLELGLIERQSQLNLQNDIYRTFSQMAMHCEKSPELCKEYSKRWTEYWVSRGFKIFVGDLASGRVAKINIDIVNGKTILRPAENISNYGIILTGETNFTIKGGVWYEREEGTGKH